MGTEDKKMKKITIKIDEKSLKDIAYAINIRKMIGQFCGPCDALAFIVGVSIENGKSEVEITDIKGLASKLADKLNSEE